MVWPFWSSSSSTPDAVKNLDPDLQEFVNRESPKPARDGPKSPASSRPSPHNPSFTHDDSLNAESATADPPKPDVPPQSLFQDGRYASLWSTYRSPAELSSRSENERLKDMADDIDWRAKEVVKAAKLNCALEALAESDCFQRGTWMQKATMCRTETRALDRCMQMQSKFLRALGYLSVPGRSELDEERIQMHADSLYHQMLEHEEAIRQAKEQGLPAPVFQPIMSQENLARMLGTQLPENVELAERARKTAQSSDVLDNVPSNYRKEIRKTLEAHRKNMESMSADERSLEEATLLSKMSEHGKMVEEYTKALDEQKRERQQRRQEGKETVTDRVRSWWWSDD
jgi:hypothetical protein